MDWDEVYKLSFPTSILFGYGASQELGPHLLRQEVKRPIIVTDSVIVELEFFKQIRSGLESHGVDPTVFTDIHKNPCKADVARGTEAYRSSSCDGVIGLGGGAAMDVARAIALKINHPEDLFCYEESSGGDGLISNTIPHFVTVPTTSGTGSEVGRSSIIADDKTNEKKVIFHPSLMAKQVFADPKLTAGLPPGLTAATGMDALTHHMEALVATGFNPLCDGIAMEGIKLISRSLVGAVKNPGHRSRSEMMMASLMGAVAFQKGLGVVHSTAHSLSAIFDIHHGLANAIMLPHGVAFNEDACSERYAEVARIFGARDLAAHLRKLNEEIGLPAKLSSQGVEESDIDKLARLAFRDGCHSSNPKPVSEPDLQDIFRGAL